MRFEDQYELRAHNTPHFAPDFRFLWPKKDRGLIGAIADVGHVHEHVLPHVPEERRFVCVQAGGAVGVWPKLLAREFETVYTFEPNPESFRCLCHNVPELNVVKFNAALGKLPGLVKMAAPEYTNDDNIGAYRVYFTHDAYVPTLALDSFAFERLDLLYLDLEGFEQQAIAGAMDTIEACRPVIVLEDKVACTVHYGYQPGEIEAELKERFGYTALDRFQGGRDVILIP